MLYVANGSHAIYARTGNIDHTIPNFNTTLPFLLVDHCEIGQPLDPLLTSYVYSYTPASRRSSRKKTTAPEKPSSKAPFSKDLSSKQGSITGAFSPLTPHTPPPGWLYFNGHWGDQEYKADDERQDRLLVFRKFVNGPTGPADKELARKRVWPENAHAAGQIVRTSLDGSTRLRDQLKRWGWKAFGGEKKAMKVKGSPKRVYVNGAAVEGTQGDEEVAVHEEVVDKA